MREVRARVKQRHGFLCKEDLAVLAKREPLEFILIR